MTTRPVTKLTDADRSHVQAILDRHIDALRAIEGFVVAEPGFPIVGGRVLHEASILVFVTEKRSSLALTAPERLPPQIEGVRVDVMTATAQMQLPPVAALEVAAADVGYEGLEGNPINDTFDVEAPILCHVGPDAGWAVFRDFVSQTRSSLNATIYDFNAEYIANALIESAQDTGFSIRLSIDDGLARDEIAIQTRLAKTLGDAYEETIIQCGSKFDFPSAYHEKVAIRDNVSMWLSSGNWSRRSQPEIDPIGVPDDARGMYGKGNREWHLIVDDEPLASVFAQYIEHDRRRMRKMVVADVGSRKPRPDLFVPIDSLVDAEAVLEIPTPVPPESLPRRRRKVKVQPVLSPDNYADRIIDLVHSADSRLYLQYSYITWTSAQRDRRFSDLLVYLGELSFRDEFDLRVIVGSNDAAEKSRRLVQEAGWNEDRLRSQRNIHNKGIIVDGKAVLVSSQNWSGDGFLRNRDAGLIVRDAEIAGYFENVFLDDWDSRAKSPFVAATAAIVATEGAPTPRGMARVRWVDLYGDEN